ncbi:hypothetical protein, partial [Dolosigranulum pigrum]|uniref:hypothetical protein n=1 Tax=Dolosigranulum pigrum TaxID=29394 RepID=UPI000DBF4757
LTYHLNMSIMKKSESLQTIHFFENSEFLNNIELVSSEASWRPVNLYHVWSENARYRLEFFLNNNQIYFILLGLMI